MVEVYSTQDVIYLLAVLAPTKRNRRLRKKLHKLLEGELNNENHHRDHP